MALFSKAKIGNIMKDYVKPLAFGGIQEYGMKTVAFNITLDGVEFKLPSPAPDVDWGAYLTQSHMLAGFGMAVGLPMLVKQLGRDYRVAAMGYMGGKIVSENFGVSRSPFKTSPKGEPVETASYVRSS